MTTTDSLTLRVAGPADTDALERLAALDSAAPLSGTVLLAELSGTAVAALATADDRVVADPFTLTDDVVAVLRARRATTS